MKRFSSILAFALLACQVTRADVITQTKTIADHVPPGTQTLTFDQFDTTLGTLNSIRIVLSLSMYGGYLYFDNDSSLAVSGTAMLGSSAGLTSSDVGLVNDTLGTPWATVASTVSKDMNLASNVIPGDPPVDKDGTSTFDVGGDDYDELTPPGSGSPVTTVKDDYVSTAAWGGYQGTGTYGVDFTSAQIVQLLSGGVQGQISAAHTFGSVTVIYDYTPVPEPATGSLAIAAVLMLVRRRRQ